MQAIEKFEMMKLSLSLFTVNNILSQFKHQSDFILKWRDLRINASPNESGGCNRTNVWMVMMVLMQAQECSLTIRFQKMIIGSQLHT
jgi:hypothetical protein